MCVTLLLQPCTFSCVTISLFLHFPLIFLCIWSCTLSDPQLLSLCHLSPSSLSSRVSLSLTLTHGRFLFYKSLNYCRHAAPPASTCIHAHNHSRSPFGLRVHLSISSFSRSTYLSSLSGFVISLIILSPSFAPRPSSLTGRTRRFIMPYRLSINLRH